MELMVVTSFPMTKRCELLCRTTSWASSRLDQGDVGVHHEGDEPAMRQVASGQGGAARLADASKFMEDKICTRFIISLKDPGKLFLHVI